MVTMEVGRLPSGAVYLWIVCHLTLVFCLLPAEEPFHCEEVCVKLVVCCRQSFKVLKFCFILTKVSSSTWFLHAGYGKLQMGLLAVSLFNVLFVQPVSLLWTTLSLYILFVDNGLSNVHIFLIFYFPCVFSSFSFYTTFFFLSWFFFYYHAFVFILFQV